MALVLPPYSRGAGRTTGPGLGTNTFLPGSIDSTFEYNGILLNYRKWWDTYLITSIAGMDGIDIRDNREDKPEQHGEQVYENFYSGRSIILTGKIRAYSYDKMRDMAQALRQAFASMEELPLTIRSPRSSTEVKINCRLTGKIDMLEEQRNYLYERDFQISLRASYPFFESVTRRVVTATFPAGSSNADWQQVVVNEGTAPAPLNVKIYGPSANTAVAIAETGKYFQINGNVTFNRTLEIDSKGPKSFTDTGAKDFQRYNVLSDLLYLVPGNNTLIVSSQNNTIATKVDLRWNDTWI